MSEIPPPQASPDAAPTTCESAEEMTAEQLAEARAYGAWQLRLDLADSALDVAYLATFAVLAARPLDAWLATWLANDWLRLLALYGIMIGVHECVSFPLAFTSGFVVEHRFGLSRQSLAAWLARHLKRYALSVVFGGVMVAALFALFWFVGALWWLAAAAAFFLASIVLGQLAPVLILPLFYKIEPLTDEELSARIGRLAGEAGLSVRGVFRMVMSDETAKANAMLAGLGRTRRVLLGDTLLAGFTHDEIEVVFAHEMGHHVFNHIPKLMAVGFAYSVLGFWVCDRALCWWVGPAEYDPARMPVWALPPLMLVLALFSLCLTPLQNIVSRRFERQCDRYALAQTGLRGAYVSAFRKLAKLNKDDPHPPRWEVFLFHSHPPIGERIALAEP